VTRSIYDDFGRLLFLHVNRESSDLTNEIPEESGQFRFLRVSYYANIKGSVGLNLTKASAMRMMIVSVYCHTNFVVHSRGQVNEN
jgi:hypothetical protein